MPIVELRQYTLQPGGRDTLIRLFETALVEGQERCGMHVLGTFRDLDDPQRFVWLRAFSDMDARARALAGFYGGPVWRRHRDVANATMIDSDDVLLLSPGWDRSGLDPYAAAPVPAGEPGVVYAGVMRFAAPVDAIDLMYFCDELAPAIRDARGRPLACLVSEHSTNTFPALPVREGENALVWLAGFPHPPAPDLQGALDRVTARWPGLLDAPLTLRLAPTPTSRVTGVTPSTFAPVQARSRRWSA